MGQRNFDQFFRHKFGLRFSRGDSLKPLCLLYLIQNNFVTLSFCFRVFLDIPRKKILVYNKSYLNKRFSQLFTQFKQFAKNSNGTGIEPMTSALSVQCSTNWAIKPTGRELREYFLLHINLSSARHIWTKVQEPANLEISKKMRSCPAIKLSPALSIAKKKDKMEKSRKKRRLVVLRRRFSYFRWSASHWVKTNLYHPRLECCKCHSSTKSAPRI